MVEIKQPNKETEFEIVNISGWKGKSEVSITGSKDFYIVREYRKSKETGETYTDEHTIPKENVRVLWSLIRDKCEQGAEYKYRFLVRMVLNHYKFHETENQPLEQFMEAFNGGKNRAQYYFPYVYYPIKVLENKGLLIFFGRGGIMKISNDELI